MARDIDLKVLFQQEAAKIMADLKSSKMIHPTNIRACGNIVEQSVRSFIEDKLPLRFHVGQGHIIDEDHKVSPQIDVLITDSTSLPIMLKTTDSTDYYPIESIYGFGEIKSTYRKSSKQIKKFCDTIKYIKSDMHRNEEENTAYKGQLKNDTLLSHLNLGCPNRTLNPLFSFLIFVDGKDFRFDHFKDYVGQYESQHLPNIIILLNKGVVIKTIAQDSEIVLDLYPEYDTVDSSWSFNNLGGNDEFAGINLTILYFYLLMHLKDCHLSAPNYLKYFQNIMPFSKSRLERI